MLQGAPGQRHTKRIARRSRWVLLALIVAGWCVVWPANAQEGNGENDKDAQDVATGDRRFSHGEQGCLAQLNEARISGLQLFLGVA